MAKLNNVLITGPNGFIGTQIARNLIASEDVKIFALVRADDPQAKLEREWWEFTELINVLGTKIHPIKGDVRQLNLGLEEKNTMS